MNGLELSERYYRYTAEVFERCCPDGWMRATVGLVGAGSECFGYDDEISRDHDWGLRYCIWLDEEDCRQYGEELSGIYDSLSKTYLGYIRPSFSERSCFREGVITTEDYYLFHTGFSHGPQTEAEWIQASEERLASVSNGRIFKRGSGQFLSVRELIRNYYPENIRRMKIREALFAAGQAGQYNYRRCLEREEVVAAEMSFSEFVKNTAALIYLLNRVYKPFYKWQHRGMRDLGNMAEAYDLFRLLYKEKTVSGRIRKIDDVCRMIAGELDQQGFAGTGENFLAERAFMLEIGPR